MQSPRWQILLQIVLVTYKIANVVLRIRDMLERILVKERRSQLRLVKSHSLLAVLSRR